MRRPLIGGTLGLVAGVVLGFPLSAPVAQLFVATHYRNADNRMLPRTHPTVLIAWGAFAVLGVLLGLGAACTSRLKR